MDRILEKGELSMRIKCAGTSFRAQYSMLLQGFREPCLQSKGVARWRPGSPGFNIFSSGLNVNRYPFKRSNSLLDKGQLLKGKNFFPLGVDTIFERLPYAGKQRESHKTCSILFYLGAPQMNSQQSLSILSCFQLP